MKREYKSFSSDLFVSLTHYTMQNDDTIFCAYVLRSLAEKYILKNMELIHHN